MIYNVIKRSLKEIMYISDSELRIKPYRKPEESSEKPDQESEKSDKKSYENDTIGSLYQNIIKYLSRVKERYPIHNQNKEDNNIFVKMFFNLGIAMNLWSCTYVDEQPKRLEPGSEEYHMYGEYKIKPVFNDYCEFVTTEMPKKNNVDTKKNEEVQDSRIPLNDQTETPEKNNSDTSNNRISLFELIGKISDGQILLSTTTNEQ